MDFIIVFAWLAVAFYMLSALGARMLVGKPRQPLTNKEADQVTIMSTIMIVLLIALIVR